MATRNMLISLCSAVAVVLLLTIGCSQPLAGPAAVGTGEAYDLLSARTFFHAKCSRCHEAQRGYAYVADRTRWINLAARMAVLDREWISPSDLRKIISYHDHHKEHLRNLFILKCGSCHRMSELWRLDKTPAQWMTNIRFMGFRFGGGLSEDEQLVLFNAFVNS